MYGDEFQPSRAELDREAYEDWLAETYEARLRAFCREWHLDPESLDSVLAYEQAWKEDSEGDTDADWRPT